MPNDGITRRSGPPPAELRLAGGAGGSWLVDVGVGTGNAGVAVRVGTGVDVDVDVGVGVGALRVGWRVMNAGSGRRLGVPVGLGIGVGVAEGATMRPGGVSGKICRGASSETERAAGSIAVGRRRAVPPSDGCCSSIVASRGPRCRISHCAWASWKPHTKTNTSSTTAVHTRLLSVASACSTHVRPLGASRPFLCMSVCILTLW